MSVPPCLLLICMLIYCTHSQMKNSVIFNTNSTSKSYPYAYTTLGNPPTTTLHADVVILSKLNLSNDCWFTKHTNVSLLQGKIVILDSLPDWFSCTSLPEGRPSVFGRIVQRAGAVGVIMQAHESVCTLFSSTALFFSVHSCTSKHSLLPTHPLFLPLTSSPQFYYGSFLSIDSTIKVPFVAIQGPQFYDLVSNSSTVLSVEFPAISSKGKLRKKKMKKKKREETIRRTQRTTDLFVDASFLTTLHGCFIFDKILLGTLYPISIHSLFCIMFFFDLQYVWCKFFNVQFPPV